MKSSFARSKPVIYFLASRPAFLSASVAPVLVGSAMGFAASGHFNPYLFVLAVLAIIFLHAGANITNDFFDHTSRNDWLNQNPTPFSGGRRFIQTGVLSPAQTLTAALVALAAGSALGLVIVLLTRSLFILALGLAGLLGGYFYTASPIRLGYRSIGELVIALLFGLLPVFGAYYLQALTINTLAIIPGLIVGILIFLVILINEFPDAAADTAANKKTLIVRCGIPAGIKVYRTALIASYVIAAVASTYLPSMRFAGLLYLLTAPIAVFAFKAANQKDLTTPGMYTANKITIAMHSAGSLALALGFVIQGLCNPAV
jgi:1,4-dihydroxy-2-naphthoate octaprenyltransferase